ncbi:MAG: FeoA family protein [Desulfopila sp.]|jgi:ferrous iron transport protein A|nr:FeoA family protein [Desulfopila sp.]
MDNIVLRQMQKGQSGIIASINASGELGRRLMEMGLVPGTKIKIQGRAPLKDPVAIQVMDCTITLRNNEADHIIITPLN